MPPLTRNEVRKIYDGDDIPPLLLGPERRPYWSGPGLSGLLVDLCWGAVVVLIVWLIWR